MNDETDRPSAPCFAHELQQSTGGSFHLVDPQQHGDVMRWRRSERKRLIEARLAMPAAERAAMAAEISQRLLTEIGALEGRTISFYWPLRGEPDLRALIDSVAAAGARCALPVVVERNAPLEFHAWAPGDALKKGFWGIPVPEAENAVLPDVILAPVVGFDAGCYRLGYGGGYFDRTLSVIAHSALVVGIGYTAARIATIFPQPHDIALDRIVTQSATLDRPAP
ncbi:MAG: 5-formyltetrahydrofolate cyclo-ligase [Rhodobiaceae bacterium]|nr:5-formyltetrahydrofolate cyclo-ligase [Rhodobiaceae bacterium]MCC0053822.1 5-formyltetrahydrofolate cyclo-ligase [Rhodobiaceae bacterium]